MNAKLSKQDIIRIFGEKGGSLPKIALALDIRMPCLSGKDLFGVFKAAFELYMSKEDMPDRAPPPGDPPESRRSARAFMNMYRLLTETDVWKESLEDGSFARLMSGYRRLIKRKIRKNPLDRRLPGLFEIVCEFEDAAAAQGPGAKTRPVSPAP